MSPQRLAVPSLILPPSFSLFSLPNLLGVVVGLLLPQFKSPTGDLNVTMAMALVVFLLSQVYAVKTHGLKGYLVSFFKPNPFLPLNLIELITRPPHLGIPAFGNIFAGEVLLVILYLLVPVVIPTVWSAFSVFIGVIQAYLFLMLGIAYISSSIEE